jgi:hypothetical protein
MDVLLRVDPLPDFLSKTAQLEDAVLRLGSNALAGAGSQLRNQAKLLFDAQRFGHLECAFVGVGGHEKTPVSEPHLLDLFQDSHFSSQSKVEKWEFDAARLAP